MIKHNSKKKDWLKEVLVFIVFFSLSYLFIYSGDDWAWGSTIGIERLNVFFANYNGRYLGNLSVLILTRSRMLKSLVMSLVLFGIVTLINKIVNKTNYYFSILSILLILAIPKYMFRQAIVWTSGFANYVIPVVLLLFYYYYVSCLFNKKQISKFSLMVMFLLGFCSTLFMEHITIYCVLLSGFVMIFEFCKKKKVSLYNILYFIGALIGTLVMFSNEAYYSISVNADSYRTAPTSGFFNMIKSAMGAYFNTIYKELVFNNVILIFLIILLTIILTYVFFKKDVYNKEKCNKKILLYICSFITLSYGVYQLLSFVNPDWQIVLKYTNYFNGIYTMLFYISIVIITFITVNDKTIKYKLLFYLFSIVIMTTPLLVVTPIGPRCFFPMYILFILFVCTILNYLMDNKTININLSVKIFTIFITVSLYVYLTSIYLYIYKEDKERLDYIHREIENNKKSIEIKELPYSNYVWTGNPSGTIWNTRYKLFYDIDEDIEIKVVKRK